MYNKLLLGTSKTDITPESPIPLAGFDNRRGEYEGIRQPLYARCWLFQQTSAQGNTHKALLVQADLIWWGTDRIETIRHRIKREHGLDDVVLHATHTHSGPQTSAMFVPSLGEYVEAYVRTLEDRLLQGIAAAASNMEPVHIEGGIGSCRIGIHRRKFVDGQMMMMPNESGEFDPDVHVFRFVKSDGAVKGILFHYSCHPTTTRENYVSSEFPGVAMELVEAQYGNTVVASYLQGCCGDVRPALIRDNEFVNGTFMDVNSLGHTLGGEVLRILNQPMKGLEPSLQGLRRKTVPLPSATRPDKRELERLCQGEGAAAEWSRLLLKHPDRVRAFADLEMSLLHIAEGLSFLGLNGEPVLQYGLTIKRLSGGKVLPLGYTDGMIGYIPTALQLREGGYEPFDSHYYFGLPGPFAPESETLLTEQIESLLNELVSV